MEMHHSNARLSIYGMGDVSTFMIKGDASLLTQSPFTYVIGDVQ
jgi:hypothetical protein